MRIGTVIYSGNALYLVEATFRTSPLAYLRYEQANFWEKNHFVFLRGPPAGSGSLDYPFHTLFKICYKTINLYLITLKFEQHIKRIPTPSLINAQDVNNYLHEK